MHFFWFVRNTHEYVGLSILLFLQNNFKGDLVFNAFVFVKKIVFFSLKVDSDITETAIVLNALAKGMVSFLLEKVFH